MKHTCGLNTFDIEEIQTLQIKAACSSFHHRLSYHIRSYPGFYLKSLSIYNLNLPGPLVESAALYKYIMNPEHIPVPLAGISSSNVHTGTFIRRQFVTREHRFFQGSRLYGIISFKVIKVILMIQNFLQIFNMSIK